MKIDNVLPILIYNLLFVLILCNDVSASQPLRVALVIGHTADSPGATSARGEPEYEFNKRMTQDIFDELNQTDLIQADILNISEEIPLRQRANAAELIGADILLSIHHDSVQPQFFETWNYNGKKRRYSDKYSGFSIFVSRNNGEFFKSSVAAQVLGSFLVRNGYRPTLHHSEKIPGENRELLDLERGVYFYDDLIVLKLATMPAVLLECGVIVNRREEENFINGKFRKKYAKTVAEALIAYHFSLSLSKHHNLNQHIYTSINKLIHTDKPQNIVLKSALKTYHLRNENGAALYNKKQNKTKVNTITQIPKFIKVHIGKNEEDNKLIEIMATEMTQNHWTNHFNQQNRSFNQDKLSLPVENITIDTINTFINELNSISKKYRYRLPLETEWKSVCSILNNVYKSNHTDKRISKSQLAWTMDNSDLHTHPVGEKDDLDTGLYDMWGNVAEMCLIGNPGSKNQNVTVCGGDYSSSASRAECSCRLLKNKAEPYATVGFRLVRERENSSK